MNFQPRTEKEIAESKIMPKGEYDFEITDGRDTESKAGNPMIVLTVRVSNGKGGGRTITDYLLAETPEKLRHCADACSLIDRYNTGNLSGNEFKGKRGRLRLGIQKDRKHQYPDKNVVLDYVCASGASRDKIGGGPVLSFQ
jgi:hypothetical protein